MAKLNPVEFIQEVRQEVSKVTWPTWKEVWITTAMVLVMVTLITPIAMEQGLRFAIREGGKTVGAGVVAKIIE